MAHESGVIDFRDALHVDYVKEIVENLRLFAELVAAAEREACAKMCDGWLHADGSVCAEAIRARGNT